MRILENRIGWFERRRSDGRFPTHWWLADLRRHQASCDHCDRCDGERAA